MRERAFGDVSPTRMRGLSEAYGSWNTIWMRVVRLRAPADITGSPSIAHRPSGRRQDAGRSRARACDLPQPDSPTRPSVSPCAMSSETSSTACTGRFASARCRKAPADAGRPARSAASKRFADATGCRMNGRVHARASRPADGGSASRAACHRLSRGAASQTASARGQRGLKAQPGGSAASDGVAPGICISSRPGAAREGSQSIRPCV